jgi:predicted RNase H-like nuclease (RuvC/YqgF family)
MTIRLVKEARDALEAKLKEQNAIIIEQGKDIASLQAQLKSKDELIERYVQLLQNRNPEMEIFMKNSTKALEAILETLKNLVAKPTVVLNNQAP